MVSVPTAEEAVAEATIGGGDGSGDGSGDGGNAMNEPPPSTEARADGSEGFVGAEA